MTPPFIGQEYAAQLARGLYRRRFGLFPARMLSPDSSPAPAKDTFEARECMPPCPVSERLPDENIDSQLFGLTISTSAAPAAKD